MPGIAIGNCIPFNRGGVSWSSYWALNNKVLFLWTGKFDGNNLLSDIDDTVITVTGKDFSTSYIPYTSAATFAVPDNATYEAADTDLMWFDGSGTPESVGIAELVGYDYERTIIKYDSASPHHVRAIMILKSGEVLTATEIDMLHNDFELWMFWSGVLNGYGVIKENRTLSADFNPSLIENMELWLRADTGVTVTGSGISEVLDYSGKNNHAIQTVDANRPPLLLNEMNGLPVINPTAASQQFFALTNSITLTDFTIIVPWKYNAGEYNFVLGLSSSTNTYLTLLSTNIAWRALAVMSPLTVSAPSQHDHVIDIVTRASGSVNGYRNEVAASTNPLTNTNNMVVNRMFANASTNYGTMKLPEIMVYSRLLTTAELSGIIAYTKEKYAITY